MSSNEEWVIQELCYLQNTKDGKYEDVTVFLADGLVKGISSRISPSEIVNVCQGGKFQAAILQAEQAEKTNQEYELQSKIVIPPKYK
jgi:hypothetical protein